MSRAGVGIVVEKLLADQNLRIRFALDPMETIAELLLRGCDLTGDEIELFCRADPRVWFLGEMVTRTRATRTPSPGNRLVADA